MDCKTLADLLSRQTLADLSADQRAAVAAHMDSCAACREKWGLDQQSQALHEAARPLVGEKDLKDAVLAKLDGAPDDVGRANLHAEPEPAPGGPEPGAPPKRLGGYELLGRLGKGGMGTVLKARQVSMDRLVALKILPPDLAKDEAFVARFLREARSAAKLNHTNIVQGYDAGEADGVYYFAMEFVDGPTVKTLIQREGRIEEKRALTIVGAVARGLDEAHRHGLIHRDIKPENVMINSRGIVKLADLGLARSTSHGYEDTVTREGTVLGTPHYMAPEQARGDPDIDTRADIYALGATLYHMVTGEFPFSGPTPAAIMAKHITEPPPNPSEKNPALSPAASHLVQRMMAKNPADRPQSPADLLAEVRDALEGKIKLRSAATRTLAAASSPLPPGEGRVRDAAGRGAPRGRPNRGGDKPRPYIWLLSAAGLLLAAVAGFLLLRPGSGTPAPTMPFAPPGPSPSAGLPKSLRSRSNRPLSPSRQRSRFQFSPPCPSRHSPKAKG